ncbi:MAG: uroporphyrinogen decarboxylase [Candidatus Omnitrophica bacterium]|nr:uroporphyrinogen decarboxylase [Candidatus Omnitrophota bacterium]
MATSLNSKKPLLLRALLGEETERTPVWLMRQAGRSDPEYRAYRKKHSLPLEKLFRDPEHAYPISLLPKRIGVDAVIFFQDILTPLAPMGAEFLFRPGPVLEERIAFEDQIEGLQSYDPSEGLPFVGETLSNLRRDLEDDIALLGFAGAPLTLLFFMVSGKSPGDGKVAKEFLRKRPDLAHRLMEKLSAVTSNYLDYQIESGAQAVQLFESIADLLSEEEYKEFALPYQVRVFESMRSNAPKILFAKQFPHVGLMKKSRADVLSVSSLRSLSEIREELGEDTVLQGNVSNRLLVDGTPEEIESAAKNCIMSGAKRGHVLNLDHGILPETPWENVQVFVKTARES